MANLWLQTAATINASKTQVNASLQQMAATQAQLQQQQQQMMQQMAMMSFTPQQVVAPAQYIPAPVQYNPMFQQQQGTRYAGTRTGGRGRGGSHGGCSRCGRSGGRGGMMMPAPMPFMGGTQMIPYLPIGAQQQVQHPPNPRFSNIVKLFANQNVCFTCGFNVEDWHTSATCPPKKAGHQDGFTCAKYMEYECANHKFCRKGMHKTMYPSM